MPRILTIDDSSTIRSIITKQMSELGFEVDHAENGQHGLAKLDATTVDLILLDVTDAGDGRTDDARRAARARRPHAGDHADQRVKRSIVAGAIKLGIEDYILKPFKPDELRGKVMKARRVEGSNAGAAPPAPAIAAVAAAAAAPAPAPAPASSAQRPGADVLVVDDMENVHKKLRGLLARARPR